MVSIWLIKKACHTDWQPHKPSEITGNVRTWSDALYLVCIALCLDVFAPMHHIKVAMREESHDPVIKGF